MAQKSGGVQLSVPQIYSGLRDNGLSHTQAANLAGVLQHESGGYTGSFGGQPTERGGVLNPGGAYGLAQFNGPRQAELNNFAIANGGSPSNPSTQLAFIAQDTQNRGINLNSTSDIVNRYEVPRVDLRAGEIASANRVARGISPSDYTPGTQASNGLPTSSDGQTQAAGGNVTTDAGDGTITSYKENADGSAEVTLGGTNPSDSPMGSGAAAGSGNAGGQAQAGSGASNSDGSGSGGSGFGAFMTDVGRAVGNALAPATARSGQVQASATRAAGSEQAKATTTAGTTVAKGSTDAATIAAKQAQADTTIAADSFKDYFGRAVVIILGIVFVGGGVAMFVFNKNPVAMATKAVKSIG